MYGMMAGGCVGLFVAHELSAHISLMGPAGMASSMQSVASRSCCRLFRHCSCRVRTPLPHVTGHGSHGLSCQYIVALHSCSLQASLNPDGGGLIAPVQSDSLTPTPRSSTQRADRTRSPPSQDLEHTDQFENEYVYRVGSSTTGLGVIPKNGLLVQLNAASAYVPAHRAADALATSH